MKTVLMTITALLFAWAASANSDSTHEVVYTKVIRGKNDMYRIIVPSLNNKEMKIILRNPKGKIIEQQTVRSKNGYMLPLNLAGAIYGAYTVEFKAPGYNHNTVINHQAAQKLSVVPISDGRYKVVVDNRSKDDFYLTVRNNLDQIIHSDHFDQGKSITKIYDLTSLKTKDFTFSLNSYTVSSDVKITK